MLKRCEECGYEYSSYAEKCPKCYYPNRHAMRDASLEIEKADAEFSIIKSIISIVLFLVFTYLLHTFGALPLIIAAFLAAIFASIMTATGAGFILTFIIIIGLCYLFSEVIPLSGFAEDVSMHIFVLFPVYYMIIRPVFKIIRIIRINHAMKNVHTKDVERSNDLYYKQARAVNENTPEIDADAIQVDYIETDI